MGRVNVVQHVLTIAKLVVVDKLYTAYSVAIGNVLKFWLNYGSICHGSGYGLSGAGLRTRLKTVQMSTGYGLCFFIKFKIEKSYRIDWSVILVYINLVHLRLIIYSIDISQYCTPQSI